MAENLANDFATLLDGAINSSVTSLVVDDTPPLAASFRIRIDDEILLVTAIGGTGNKTWTVTRGAESTTAASHADNAPVTHILTAGGLAQYVSDNAGGGGGANISATRIRIEEDLIWQSVNASTRVYAGGVVPVVGGTAGDAAMSSGGDNPGFHPGLVQLSTGSSSNGRLTLSSRAQSWVYPGKGVISFGAIISIPSFPGLSNGTNRYTLRMGLSDSNSGDASNGIYFRYVDDQNSGKWQAITTDGTETSTDTGVTAAADDLFHRFEFVVNAAGTSVGFYIDGTLVATNTTHIPAVATGFVPLSIIKSVGTTFRTVLADAYWFEQALSTSR